MHVSTIL